MRTRFPATLHQASETKTDIGWYIGAHAEQFTHGLNHSLLKPVARLIPGS
ncbi:Uncharacterised protein [Vibrio cholerae]|nr:Uncharacterised protein [Vibrio cholerae]